MPTICHQLSLDTLGGVEALFYDYLCYSSRLPLKHHLLVNSYSILTKYQAEIERQAHSINYSKYWKGVRIPRFLNSFKEHLHKRLLKRQKSDLLVFWNSFCETVTLKAAKQSHCPMIYYDHGAAFTHPDPQKNQHFLQQVDGVISCSYASKRILEMRWNYKGPISIVKNPLRPQLQGKISTPKQLNPNRTLKLGIVGRLVPVKGTCIALHALKHLISKGIDAELHIVGEGKEKSRLIETAHKLSISSQLKFRGVMHDISGFYREIDLLLCPSIREPFGLVALESAAHGCPVICSRIDGLPEIIQHGKMGYCLPHVLSLKDHALLGGKSDPYRGDCFDPMTDQLVKPGLVSPTDIASNIVDLLNQPEKYAKMSEYCMVAANENFSFSEYVEQLENAIINYCK